MNATATINVGALLPAQVFKSRFGYHPVSKETDKKLRYLNAVHQKALHLAGAWRRWYAKQLQNRVHKTRLRDADGKVTGYGESVPWSEPAVCPVFSDKETKQVQIYWPVKGFVGILAVARQARTPYATPEEVRPLAIRVEEINTMYDMAQEWMASRKK